MPCCLLQLRRQRGPQLGYQAPSEDGRPGEGAAWHPGPTTVASRAYAPVEVGRYEGGRVPGRCPLRQGTRGPGERPRDDDQRRHHNSPALYRHGCAPRRGSPRYGRLWAQMHRQRRGQCRVSALLKTLLVLSLQPSMRRSRRPTRSCLRPRRRRCGLSYPRTKRGWPRHSASPPARRIGRPSSRRRRRKPGRRRQLRGRRRKRRARRSARRRGRRRSAHASCARRLRASKLY